MNLQPFVSLGSSNALFNGIETDYVDRWGLAVLGPPKGKDRKRVVSYVNDPDGDVRDSYPTLLRWLEVLGLMSARAGSTAPDCFAIVGFERRRPEEPEDALKEEEEDLCGMNDDDDANGGFCSVNEFNDFHNDENSLENQDHLGDSKNAVLAQLSSQNHLGSPVPSNCPHRCPCHNTLSALSA